MEAVPMFHSYPDDTSFGTKFGALLDRFRGDPARLVFLWRALSALWELGDVPDPVLWRGLAQSSNRDLLEVWIRSTRTQPGRSELPDPTVAEAEAELAKLRSAGGRIRDAWLSDKQLSSDEVATRLGITRQAVNVRRQEGKLLAARVGRSFVYPEWQFHGDDMLPGLERVLVTLRGEPPLMVIQFLRSPNASLDERTPVGVLERAIELPANECAKEQESVLRLARMYGEHGAP